jgi:hypothetical protein
MNHIEGNAEFTESGAVFKQLESQFDTPAHQRQIESLACSMTMEEARKWNSSNRIAALGFLNHEVARLNAQFPKVKRGDQFRTQTLMKIVEKYEWSRTAEEEVMQDALSYDALYTKLSASLVIWEHEVARSGGDPDHADDSRSAPAAASSFIGYGAQYARPVGSRMVSSIPSSTKLSSRCPTPRKVPSAPRQNTHCFECGRQGHWRAECTFKDGESLSNAARSRIRETGGAPSKAAAIVLLELVTKKAIHNPQQEPDDDLFETLVSRAEEPNDGENDREIADKEEEQVFPGAGGH